MAPVRDSSMLEGCKVPRLSVRHTGARQYSPITGWQGSVNNQTDHGTVIIGVGKKVALYNVHDSGQCRKFHWLRRTEPPI